MSQNSIGIDISKDHLDVHRQGDRAHRRFPNTPAGLCGLIEWIGPDLPDRVVYEPAGACHGAFEQACAGRLPLVKVNPLQARRFAQACGVRAKTDAVDARMLAEWVRRQGWNQTSLPPETGLFSESYRLRAPR